MTRKTFVEEAKLIKKTQNTKKATRTEKNDGGKNNSLMVASFCDLKFLFQIFEIS